MAEQDQSTPGQIPPKITPLTPGPRPSAGPGAPRPITIRPHHAPAPVPGVSPVAPKPAPGPKATSRVPLPDGIPPSSGPAPATIRLRPATPPGAAPKAHVAPPAPGSRPLPAGPKPPSAAQVQAAKSKTSRISLDSAIGVAPVSPAGAPKTIKLKRPVDLGSAPTIVAKPVPKSATTPIRQTSKIPDVTPAAPAPTQKKPLKIKRPGAAAEPSPDADAAAFENLTPIAPMDFGAPKESTAFTAVALVAASLAAVVMILLALCLGAHAMGPGANKNTLATIDGPELPWVGRLSN